LNGGHARNSEARQILSYLMRKSLSIVRLPGTYDIVLESKHFDWLTQNELESACQDIHRIYLHTQSEMMKLGNTTIELVRGIKNLEATVCIKLLEEIDDENIFYYFQTITFFNHLAGAYHADVELKINCPLNWIWASAYTLKDVDTACDEEFMVICQSYDGVLEVPKSNFQIFSKQHSIDQIIPQYGQTKYVRRGLHQALSALMIEGFEPDNYERTLVDKYMPGKWEKRMTSFGLWLDNKFADEYNIFRNKIKLSNKKMH
jgi:hypothetical protein